MRYELESRYGPDVAYLLHGRVPEMDDLHACGRQAGCGDDAVHAARRGHALPEGGD